MAENELGKLSPEQVQKLANTISEAKNLTSQQEEIIKHVLQGETEIGNIRIASLEKYFDIYSRNLDLVARKHSALNDAFLILDKKLNDNYQKISSDLAKLEQRLESLSDIESKTSEAKKESSTKQTKGDQTSVTDLNELVNLAINTLTKSYKDDYANKLKIVNDSSTRLVELERQYQEHRFNQLTQQLSGFIANQHGPTPTSSFIPSNQADKQNTDVLAAGASKSEQQIAFAAPKGPTSDSANVFSTLTESMLSLLAPIEVTTADITTLFKEVTAAEKAHAKVLKDIQAGKIQDETEAWNKYANNIDSVRESFGSQLVSQEKELNKKIIALAIEKNLTEDDILRKSVEFRLSRLQEASDAELKAKQAANTANAQLDYTSTKKGQAEIGKLRATTINSAEELKSRKEIEEQISKFRERLEGESKAKHNGKLLKKDAAEIEELVNLEYTKRLKKLNKLTAERSAKEQLLADPKLTAEFEKKKIERKRELELKALKDNNGILTKEALLAINEQVDTEFQLRSDKGKKLLAELGTVRLADAKLEDADTRLAKLKEEDPGLAIAREAKIKQRIADLEYEYRQAHNNELNEESRKEIEYQAKLEYLTNSATIGKLAEEYKDQVKLDHIKETDPSLGAEIDKDIADRKAQLLYEAMSRTNRQLQLEELADIDAQARAEALADNNLKELSIKARNSEQRKLVRNDDPNLATKLDAQRAKELANLELEYRKENNGILTDVQKEALKALAEAEYDLSDKNLKKLGKTRQKELEKEKKARIAETDRTIAHAVDFKSLSKEDNLLDRMKDIKAIVDQADDGKKAAASIGVAAKMLSSIAKQLENTVDKIASYQGNIDTRLQGSNNKKSSGSYWNQLTKDMMSVGAVTPYFKQEDFANNIKTLVEKGISFDLKQRAFLMTIQEKIANTFNVADGTLLRLIRIQQEDSTAGRLGMESALNSFLNNMYETSEYLSDVAASVRGSLEEMEALMGGAAATEVEYQVQKWMGSLYSVGMSQNAVTSISNALGQIAAGQVEALTGDGAGNLLIMAANNAGIPIADILSKGLDADKTNQLLQATVNYLAEIAESSKDNNVVQQQLAGVFGVKASDLKAATNLAVSNKRVFGEYKTYGNMLKQLNNMAGSMNQRTSIGEMMTNIWENGQYTLASSMANNPVTYLLYKMSSLLEDTTGGISLPFISAFGTGVDLNTTVADLMRVASISGGILGSIGPMISGLASSFSGRAMLTKMGIESGSGLTVTPRGDGGSTVGIGGGGMTGGGAESTSGSGYIGNASGSDVKNSTIQEAEDTKKKLMIEAKEEEENAPVNIINMNVLKIYELLDDVAHGRSSFRVKIDGYGLTKTNSTNSLSSAQGGVAGLLNNNGSSNSGSLSGGFNTGAGGSSAGGSSSGSGGYSSGSTGGSYGGSYGGSTSGSGSGGSSTGFGVGPSVDLGGWIMT